MIPLASAELQAENRIDSICDAFEAECRAGKQPKIEDYLGETIATGRATLLLELVRVEAYYRLQAGESPRLQEYLQRFPEDASHLTARGLADALSAPATPNAEQRDSIGTFDLLEMLGEGAFGCVWKARDRRLDRIVALKLPRGSGLNAAEAAAFLREAQAAAQLRHPNIVAVYGVERDDRTAYIVSEFIEGLNLKDWLRNHKPSFEEAARLSLKLAEALAHAHAQGVVHRDLKPANILLDRAGEPHVTDFGLAKRLSADNSIHSGLHVLGTPAYMSPEQAAGNSKLVDPRTDLYSLGIILYELLTGIRAFEGDQQTILRLVLSDDPTPPRQVRPEIPRGLETICLKAIARNRDDRYPSVKEFAADLNRYLRSEPVQARRPRPAHDKALWTRRRFAGVALSAVPVGAYALWSGNFFDRSSGKFRPVAMKTDPAGAEVWFIPLDRRTGEPDATRIVHAGRSPVSLELPPGDYLVEVVLDERRFHEVYRHVPDATEVNQEAFAHRFSEVPAGRTVVLPIVYVPEASVTEGMARITGNSRNTAEPPDSSEARRLLPAIPAFYMDPYEFTFGEYRRANGGKVPSHYSRAIHSDNDAVPLDFDSAMAAAERIGKRLPDSAEYEYAATAGGSRPFPWTDVAAALVKGATLETFGPVDSFSVDRVDLDPHVPIFGLCSNVAEWTVNWRPANAAGFESANSRLIVPGDYRTVCGGTSRIIEGAAVVSEESRNPRKRVGLWRSNWMPGLGARFVRSVKPRITEADFARIVPHLPEEPPQTQAERASTQ